MVAFAGMVPHALGRDRLAVPGIETEDSVSLRPKPPPLVLVDEKEIPEDFWKPQPAKLDRQGLIAALKAGRDVPGATLGNSALTISVRTK